MISNRPMVVITIATFLGAFLVFASGASGAPDQDLGPSVGTWKLTAKDKAGVAWTGKLVIEKLDPKEYDPKKFVAVTNLEMENADGATRGTYAPMRYDPATRVVTIGEDSDYGGTVYTAVLSPDGKALTDGVWKETERRSDEKEKRVRSEGEWSATRAE